MQVRFPFLKYTLVANATIIHKGTINRTYNLPFKIHVWTCKGSVFPQTIRDWNALPDSLITSADYDPPPPVHPVFPGAAHPTPPALSFVECWCKLRRSILPEQNSEMNGTCINGNQLFKVLSMFKRNACTCLKQIVTCMSRFVFCYSVHWPADTWKVKK